MKHTYWSLPCLATTPSTERIWSHPKKIFDPDCTTSYVLNSGVTDPIVTEFLQDVEFRELIADYYCEITTIFQSISERQSDE